MGISTAFFQSAVNKNYNRPLLSPLIQIMMPDPVSETIEKEKEKLRHQIGRELHDNINQILSCANLYFHQLKPMDENQQEIKEKASELIILAINEIRKLSKDLVITTDHEPNIIKNIQKLVSEFQSASCIRVKFIHDLNFEPLSESKATTLYRILQEQLKNIAVHSEASEVVINLIQNENSIHFTIADNGKGANMKKNIDGIGLSNIRERVNLHNGKLSIQTKSGRGFKIEILFPL